MPNGSISQVGGDRSQSVEVMTPSPTQMHPLHSDKVDKPGRRRRRVPRCQCLPIPPPRLNVAPGSIEVCRDFEMLALLAVALINSLCLPCTTKRFCPSTWHALLSDTDITTSHFVSIVYRVNLTRKAKSDADFGSVTGGSGRRSGHPQMAQPGRDRLGGNPDHARSALDKNPVLLNWLYRDPAVHQHGLTADKAAFG